MNLITTKRVIFIILITALLPVNFSFRNSRQIFYPDRPMIYTERAVAEISKISSPPSDDKLKQFKSILEVLSPTVEEIRSEPTSNDDATLKTTPVGVPLNLLPTTPNIVEKSFPSFAVKTSTFESRTGSKSLTHDIAIFSLSSNKIQPSEQIYKLTNARGDGEFFHSPPSFDGKIPGRAGDDFPIYSFIPPTTFRCAAQKLPGYYGDISTNCQVVHLCQADGRHDSFLCPNGTIFNQQYFVCDWWFNVDCSRTVDLYSLNSKLYKQ